MSLIIRDAWVGRAAAALVAFLVASGSSAAAQEIRFHSGPIVLEQQTPAESAARLAAIPRNAGARHALVQLTAPADDAVRAGLAAAGVRLLAPVGPRSYFVALTPAAVNVPALAAVPALIAAEPIRTEWKLHPMLRAGEVPSHAVVANADGDPTIGAYALFHPDVALQQEAAAAVARHGGVVRDELETVNGLVIELPMSRAAALAAEDAVQWLEPALPQMSTCNAENRALTQAGLAQSAPYNLDGTGVNVMVYDGGTARATHVDFSGRLTVRDGGGLINHATHVSGTIGGAGVQTFNNRGMAPNVTIQSYTFQFSGGGTFLYTNPGDIETDYGQAINTYGVHISNNSIGTNTETNGFPCSIQGDYGVTDAVIDNIVRGSLGGGPFRIVWAGGNERQGSRCDVEGFGDYYSIAPPSGAKNHICVGAVNANNDSMTSFSSWGPTDDGRLKPDIVAPGCQSGGDNGVTSTGSASNTAYSVSCGTSMASPTACGCLALVLQDFRAQFPGEPDPRNSTLKILLAHNAVDLGNPGPDYQFGYGSIRIRDTIDFMRTGRFNEDEIAHGQVLEYPIEVPAATPQLRVTLAWDDPPGTPNVSPSVINDLDLEVVDPSNNVFFPWTLNPSSPSSNAVQTTPNRRDNLEQVRIDSPAAGTWKARVRGFAVPQGPQVFSICATPSLIGGPALTLSLPGGAPTTIPPGVTTNVPVRIRPTAQSVVAGSTRLYFRYDGGAFQSVPLTPVGGDDYLAPLPPPVCAATPEYYIEAEGTLTGVKTHPASAPGTVFSAVVGEPNVVADEQFEGGANGWVGGVAGDTATTGQWVQVDPNGTAAQPEDDHTPAPGVKCWVTGQGTPGGSLGEADVDSGFTTLRSPAFDLSATPDAKISYWRWYSNNTGSNPNTDVFRIQISNNDGASWTSAEVIGPSGPGTSGGWIYREFLVSSILPPTAQVRMQFIAEDDPTGGAGSLVEAALDDFLISWFGCSTAAPDCNTNGIVDSDDIASGRSDDVNNDTVPDECQKIPVVGDMNCDGVLDALDAEAMALALADPDGYAAAYPACDINNGDLAPDGLVNGDDVQPFVDALVGP